MSIDLDSRNYLQVIDLATDAQPSQLLARLHPQISQIASTNFPHPAIGSHKLPAQIFLIQQLGPDNFSRAPLQLQK
jgi:hypothetical protein